MSKKIGKKISLTDSRINRHKNITKTVLTSLFKNGNLNDLVANMVDLSSSKDTENMVIEEIFETFPFDDLKPSMIKNLNAEGGLSTINGYDLMRKTGIYICPGLYSGFFIDETNEEYLSSLILNPCLNQSFSGSSKVKLLEFIEYSKKIAIFYKNSVSVTISGFGSSSVSQLHSQMFCNQGCYNDKRNFNKAKKISPEQLLEVIPKLWRNQIYFNVVFDGYGDIFMLSYKLSDGRLASYKNFSRQSIEDRRSLVYLIINKPGGLESINSQSGLIVDKTPALDLLKVDEELKNVDVDNLLTSLDKDEFVDVPSKMVEITYDELVKI